MYFSYLNTPVGMLEIVGDSKNLLKISFLDTVEKSMQTNLENEVTKKVSKELNEYFFDGRQTFDISLKLLGTDFQKKVWVELMNIPYGQVVSYKYIADKINCPKGYRAVGLANNKNKIPIIIPCHRVVGINGNLVGYAGGIKIKQSLIDHEKNNLEKGNR